MLVRSSSEMLGVGGDDLEQDDSARRNSSRREEFLDLLRTHKHQVFNFIFCILQNMHDTEDVFQQTSLALWENYEQYKPGSNFGAWATRVARHRVSQFIRSRQRNRHLYFTDEIIDRISETPFSSPEVQQARMKALAACREKLSIRDQRLLALCYGGANSIRDAAMQIGRPVETVYSSLTRIRGRLRVCIERNLAREVGS